MAQHSAATSLEEGRQRLQELLMTLSPLGQLSNEAETRFQFIDRLLTECLGWEHSEIHVEMSQDGQYADYEVGTPRSVIVEAKKSGALFDLPAQRSKGFLYGIADMVAADEKLASAIRQCQDYCLKRGVQYAAICNGHQIVMFLASRTDGIAPLKGKALVLNGETSLVTNFSVLWQNLSPGAIAERRLTYFLSSAVTAGIPRKLSGFLTEYPRFRYRSKLQEDLRTVADLLLEDLPTASSVEKKFLEQCYCESGALSNYAMASKEVISARYSALFDRAEQAPTVSGVKAKGEEQFTRRDDVVAEALAKRPIVLIGDVGVGKTSFLRNLLLVRAEEEFNNALYLYFDLGSQGALEQDLDKFLLAEMERQLLERYEVDVLERNFVRGVYDSEIRRFRSSIWGDLYERDRPRYDEELLNFLEGKLNDKPHHLQAAIRHISRGRSRTVIFILDNADQRGFEVQQSAFLIAQNFAKEWDAIVFIAVRPQTFHHSKRSGTLSAYPPKVFTISPPRPELLIRKRLVFALDMAEGRLPIERLHGIRLNLAALSLFIKALLSSLERNKEVLELLSNITGGNMRAVVELITRFISTPNVDTDKIISKMEEGRYFIPLHEFAKVAILGDYAHYNPQSSVAANLFDVRFPDEREHFLSCLALGFVDHDGSHRNAEGFVATQVLVSELQNWGYLPNATHSALRRLTNKRLIETTERVTFEEDALGELIGDIPSALRIASVGSYHIRKWLGTFGYLDAMAFDTPVFRGEFMEMMAHAPDSFSIADRVDRTRAFRDYLSAVWEDSALNPSYFNWPTSLALGVPSFEGAERGVMRARE